MITSALGMVNSGLNGAKTAVGLAKDLRETVNKPDPDVLALRQKVAELQVEIITNKEAYLAVYDALLDLQRKAEQAEKFQLDAARYKMTQTDMGAVVYSLRPECAEGEPPHEICASCFGNDIKSVLQPVDFNTLGCGRCGGKFFKSDSKTRIMTAGGGLRTGFDILNPYGD